MQDPPLRQGLGAQGEDCIVKVELLVAADVDVDNMAELAGLEEPMETEELELDIKVLLDEADVSVTVVEVKEAAEEDVMLEDELGFNDTVVDVDVADAVLAVVVAANVVIVAVIVVFCVDVAVAVNVVAVDADVDVDVDAIVVVEDAVVNSIRFVIVVIVVVVVVVV